MEEVDETVTEFLVESYENLDKLDRDFVAFEEDSSRQGLLPSIFRTIHTIKGTCGFLGFSRLEALSHAGETLLGRLRDGTLPATPERITALLAMVDAIRGMLHSIESTGTDGQDIHGPLTAELDRLATLGPPEGPGAAPVAPPAAGPGSTAAAAEAVAPAVVSAPVAAPVATPAVVSAPVAAPVATPAVVVAPVALVAAATVRPPEPAHPEPSGPSVAESSVRVDVALLAQLMNLVGELVLTRNQLLQHTHSSGELGLGATTQRLNLITTELQEAVMRTRMHTIGSVWAKFPRLVRDLCSACGKQVRLEVSGQDTEVDRTLLDAIKDPLTHIIRNSVDHGIEAPERRLAAGKPAEGRLSLSAFHESGQVIVEIVDDGGGISVERVRNKAIERGLLTVEAAARMEDRDVLNLIFVPGFSTAEAVTSVSGRGVGMDVVRTNIERVGGSIGLDSRVGEGTRIRIRIPLTLAIVPALMVWCNGDRFAIPQVNLVELVHIQPQDVARSLERIHDAPVYRRRGRLLPILSLGEALGLGEMDTQAGVNLVVLQAGDSQFGVLVERVADTAEIVVKPLGRVLKELGVYAGATILGDGGVALILDVMGLAQHARLLAEGRSRFQGEAQAPAPAVAVDVVRMLIVDGNDGSRIAMRLDHVDRLEIFPARIIERAGTVEVAQYRGAILPLIRLSNVLVEHRLVPRFVRNKYEDSQRVPVVVHTVDGRTVGIVVDRMHDIIEERLVNLRPASRPGVLFSAVLCGRVTEVLDLDWVVGSLDRESRATSTPRRATRVSGAAGISFPSRPTGEVHDG